VEPFYQLCKKIASSGVRFVAGLDHGMDEQGIRQFQQIWLREKPDNFVIY